MKVQMISKTRMSEKNQHFSLYSLFLLLFSNQTMNSSRGFQKNLAQNARPISSSLKKHQLKSSSQDNNIIFFIKKNSSPENKVFK